MLDRFCYHSAIVALLPIPSLIVAVPDPSLANGGSAGLLASIFGGTYARNSSDFLVFRFREVNGLKCRSGKGRLPASWPAALSGLLKPLPAYSVPSPSPSAWTQAQLSPKQRHSLTDLRLTFSSYGDGRPTVASSHHDASQHYEHQWTRNEILD